MIGLKQNLFATALSNLTFENNSFHSPATFSSHWHCVHFNISDDDKCKGLTGAKQLSCEAAVCVAKGGNFSHDEHHNDKYPGCGTCWCCSEGAAPPPTPTPPAPPVDIAEVKRIGAGLLELIDDMDRLLGK